MKVHLGQGEDTGHGAEAGHKQQDRPSRVAPESLRDGPVEGRFSGHSPASGAQRKGVAGSMQNLLHVRDTVIKWFQKRTGASRLGREC